MSLGVKTLTNGHKYVKMVECTLKKKKGLDDTPSGESRIKAHLSGSWGGRIKVTATEGRKPGERGKGLRKEVRPS